MNDNHNGNCELKSDAISRCLSRLRADGRVKYGKQVKCPLGKSMCNTWVLGDGVLKDTEIIARLPLSELKELRRKAAAYDNMNDTTIGDILFANGYDKEGIKQIEEFARELG